MATIYRFVIEQKTSGAIANGGTGDGRIPRTPQTKDGAGKKGRNLPILGGGKGGVEHNRFMRPLNAILNPMTHGVWEKGVRLTRASLGLITRNTETGAIGFNPIAIAIILAFVIRTLLHWQNTEIQKAEKINAQNYKQLENGYSSIHGAYKVSVNMWNGRYTYNENK